MRKAKYMYDGMTLHKYCSTHNLSYQYVLTKIRSGLSIEDAISYRCRKNGSGYKYIYEGRPLQEYCEENDIRYGTILNRIYKGQDLKQAIECPENKKLLYTYNGQSLRSYCIQNHLNYDVICMRINRGASLEEAMKEPPRRRRSRFGVFKEQALNNIQSNLDKIDPEIFSLIMNINKIPGMVTIRFCTDKRYKIYIKFKNLKSLDKFCVLCLKEYSNLWNMCYNIGSVSDENEFKNFYLETKTTDKKLIKDHIRNLSRSIEENLSKFGRAE